MIKLLKQITKGGIEVDEHEDMHRSDAGIRYRWMTNNELVERVMTVCDANSLEYELARRLEEVQEKLEWKKL